MVGLNLFQPRPPAPNQSCRDRAVEFDHVARSGKRIERTAYVCMPHDGPKGHWEGLSLFLYNPQSHQWSQSFLNSKSAVLSGSLVGEFHDGRGELYQHDTYHDKSIFVRAVWSEITPNSHRYTESFSNDGGKTWVMSFDAHKTREKDLPPSDMAAGAEPMSAEPDGHAFDFDLGTWHTRSSRLMHPLTGSTTWADLEGQTMVHRVWGGRANLAEYKATGSTGTIELLGAALVQSQYA